MSSKFSMGADFGSNSVRVVIVNLENGDIAGIGELLYPSGDRGVHTDPKNHHLARQSPAAYLKALVSAGNDAVQEAANYADFSVDKIVGLGVDTTGSTPIPVDAEMTALSDRPEFKDNLNAYAWMWKDHTSMEEAEIITEKAERLRPQYLAKCGGTYSSEWFFSKIWHCLNIDREVFNAAESWVEFCDYVPAVLAGISKPADVKRSICAAGHKAMYCEEWGGLPDEDFLKELAPELADLRGQLYSEAFASDKKAGELSEEWAEKLGIKAGIPISVGAFDAHMGAVGSGVGKDRLVKIIGTSTCDIMVAENDTKLPDIPGVCGIVDGSVMSGYYGIEAGQSAVGDIFNWFVSKVCKEDHKMFKELRENSEKLAPGEIGLLALDWNNGNRTILVDPKLSGLIVGMTLHTERYEIYRALIEGTAFGARKIVERIEEYGVNVGEVVTCGGIAEKDPMFMQIYADVLNMPIKTAGSPQTCALGAAIFGAVIAGTFDSIESAQNKLCTFKDKIYEPNSANVAVYSKLYELYSELHDSFGIAGKEFDHSNVMKELLKIKM